MATRLDKIMEPILKEKCDKAFEAGYKKGFEAGGKNMSLAYENEINSLKRELGRKRYLLKENGEIIPLDHRWIPVAERLPSKEEYTAKAKDGEEYYVRLLIAYKTDIVEYEIGYYDGYKWFTEMPMRKITNVVAWMVFPNLPQPPKEV